MSFFKRLLRRLVEGREAPELTLLDALARAPAAAALVVAALEEEDRKALRLAHSQLRDAVNEATTRRLSLHSAEIIDAGVEALARGAWPALEELDLRGNDLSGRLTLDGARRWAPALRWLETLNIKHYWI